MATYLITRSPAKAAGFTREMAGQDATARVLTAPLLEAVGTEPEDWGEVAFALIRGEFSWVTFTSVNGVLGLDALAQGIGQSLGQLLGAAQLAAVGRATEAALTERGLLVDFVPETQSAAGMVDEWLLDEEWDNSMSETVLAVQGTTASPVLEEGLTDYGYTVVTLPVYTMEPYPASHPLVAATEADADALTLDAAVAALAGADVLVATSPLLLRTLAEAAGTRLPPTVAIGASTAAATQKLDSAVRPATVSTPTSPAPADLAAVAFALTQT
ncbi:uroporphyrinogen-III synthase [Rothia nasisuis]|uniref:uroporphyrinogen-III synthase n=1 Tax=Rothia nasisuis TaxID=2109647 RepID=UPI001F2EBD1E|nr:uroporphyrinogen-III synthase [Rothia nasisuis]